MEAYYVPMEHILAELSDLSIVEQTLVIASAGVYLDLAYPTNIHKLNNKLRLAALRIVTELREVLTRVFRCGVLEYLYITIYRRGVIYVKRR